MIITRKRNFKKISPISKDNETLKLIVKRNATSMYRFPEEESVPPGLYVSKIIDVLPSRTRSNMPAYDVCYKILDFYVSYKLANKLPVKKEEICFYYIRQRYPKDHDCAKAFEDAMYNAGIGDDEELNLKDAIGVTEKIKLVYKSEGTLGSIDKRMPIRKKDLKDAYKAEMLKKRLYQDEYGDGYII